MTNSCEAPRRAYLGLGSNLGDKAGNIRRAVALLDADPDIRVAARSRLYRTEPWGKVDQDWFVNACIGIDTVLPPLALLDRCLATELAMGRRRHEKWGPRLIDIDILTYADEAMRTDALTLPHPFLLERAFVLIPLHEIAPHMVIGATPLHAAAAATDRQGIGIFGE